MKKILLTTLVLGMMASLLSSTAAALTSSEVQELFQQSGNTGNLVTADELNFFGCPLSEIGTDIDIVEEIMRQNNLDVAVSETTVRTVSEPDFLDQQYQSQSNAVYGTNPYLGININASRITNNGLRVKRNISGAIIGGYELVDALSYRYDYGHRTNIGIRDICMGDSLADFLRKVGFSNASVLASTINSVINSEYESDYEARSLLNSIYFSSEQYEQLRFGLFNKETLYQTDSPEIPVLLSFGDTFRCTFDFQDDMLYDCTITFSSPAANNTPSQANSSNHALELPAERLKTIENITDAVETVSALTNTMTSSQKTDPDCIDLATLYAETASAKAATKSLNGNSILINADTISNLQQTALEASEAVDLALTNGGITTARYLSNTVTFTTNESREITIRVDPDVLSTEVDKVRVEAPGYALTFKLSDLAPDLTDSLTFKAAPANIETLSVKNAVDIEVPGGNTTNSITVSLPTDKRTDTTYQAVVSSSGTATASKYNPATTNIDGKVNASGRYSVETNEVNFTDIASESSEMQKAIKYLASHGISMGSGGTNYSPNDSISRAELAALVLRALGKVDSKATTSFTDVTPANWFYTTAASSQKLGYITGFEDNTFRGTIAINKEQIIVVAARVLGSEMKYKTPSNPAAYLNKYSDTVVSWAQPQVALATRENLVIYRTDGTFSGAKNMTRGDAAIIIYRLFQRIW